MSFPSNWRQLQLFEILPIRDPNLASNPLYSDPSLAGVTASNHYMALAVAGCYIKIVSNQFTLVKEFQAYESEYRITFIHALPQSDLVVTIAEKQGVSAILKLWDLNRLVHLEEKDDAKQKFQTQVSIQNGDNAYPISAFAFNRSFLCLAVGYANGKVLLIRGDLLRDRGSKQRLVYESPDPVTGLHFNEYHELVYVTTTSRILTIPTTGRNQGRPLNIVSKKIGVALQCSAVDPESQELIVAVDSSVRFYNHLSKTHVLDFAMPKRLIHRYTKDYLLLVCPTEESQKGTRVVVLDLRYKHISFSITIPNTVINYAFSMWDDLYMLSTDGLLYRLHEKPINQQVELIVQKQVFPLAYRLAKHSGLPVQTLLRICKLHGHFLYQSQDYEESIKSYIKCLGYYKDPQLVVHEDDESLSDFVMSIISKFKDASNINSLTDFLYQLYKLNIANNDHVTLLLCCYCKLQLVDKIRLFIDEMNISSDQNDDSLSNGADFLGLDFPLIINLFKECGYFQEVIKLLHELNQPSLIVDIQLNDMRDPQKCLKYIKSLSIDDLLLILIEHSKTLLDSAPIETTELLIAVFTGKYVPDEAKSLATQPEALYEQNDSMFPLNSYKSFLAYISGNEIEDHDTTLDNLNGNSEPTYLPPRPSLIFPSFINNPNEFVIFLEACIETFEKYQGNINDKKVLLITLLEMYLSLSKKEPDSRDDWFAKARGLVEQYTDLIDTSSLLLVSHLYHFDMELPAKGNDFEENIFRNSQLNGDVSQCLEIAKKYGEKKPELYKSLLRFIVSSEDIFNKVSKKDFMFVVDQIKQRKLASPLEIIQILSSTKFATIGLIQDYLIEIIDTTNQEITNNKKLVEYYEKEAIKNSYKITELKTKPFIIQNNKCSACNLKLDFPVIHFKCKHSFHQRCLNDTFLSNNELLNSDPTCSICITDIDQAQTLRDEQLKTKDEIDLFEQTLHESTDKFKVISNYLGKGVMENEYIVLNNDV